MAEPRTEAGKRLAAYVSPASDVHEGWYPWRVVRDAILAIEAEAAHPESDPATPQGELRAALDLLNSLGIAGPNTVHRIETAEDRADPKRSQDDRDLDRALAEVGNDDEWCICGRVWPCDAKRLVDLLLAALRAVPAEAEEHDGECVMAGQVEPADASGGGEGLDVERLARAFHAKACSSTGHPAEYDRPYVEVIAAEYARLTPPAPAPASEDGLLHDTREAIQEATGAMAAALPVILAVRAWRDTPRVASKGETVRQLGNRLEQAILDAMAGLDDYVEAHPAALVATATAGLQAALTEAVMSNESIPAVLRATEPGPPVAPTFPAEYAKRLSRIVARLPRMLTEADDYAWVPFGDVLLAISDPGRMEAMFASDDEVHPETAGRPQTLDTLARVAEAIDRSPYDTFDEWIAAVGAAGPPVAPVPPAGPGTADNAPRTEAGRRLLAAVEAGESVAINRDKLLAILRADLPRIEAEGAALDERGTPE